MVPAPESGSSDSGLASAAPQADGQSAEGISESAGGPKLEGERRTVTILFADAAGFTSLSEKLDEEQVYELMQNCTRRMSEAVHRYEGNITQFRGDGIMAIFGAPIAHEDSARRAVAAALAMQESLQDLREQVHERVPADCSFRVGLNTGPVVVGNISGTIGAEYTALGDTVNLAARMEQIADPGSVTISERTFMAVQDYFDCEPLGEIEIKGKREPVRAFRVLRERPVQSRLQAAAEHGLTAFVGREQELQMLRGYLDQADRGQGQVVFISGEAGIGKSRLLLEFTRAVESRGVRWLRGSCISFGQNIGYLPIVDLVKSNFEIDETDSPADVIRKIEDGVGRWEEPARAAAPYLRYLLNVDPGDPRIVSMAPQERRAGIFDSLRAMLAQESSDRTLGLIVEDLHWVDEQSERALLSLVDAVPALKVLLLITLRPGYAHKLGERSYFNRLALRHLPPEASIAMAERLLHVGKLPGELRRLLIEKAEGNPFYIEEVTKSLLESGMLRRDGNQYRLARPIEEIRVPETIQDVILARIDRLRREAKQAMQLASVIGREFTVRLLSRISDLEAQLDDLLSELKGLELIYEKNYFPELSYMFKHALTHDVAYSTLLSERRRALHRLVARAIEELYRDRLAEHTETLAHHYYEGQDWAKALDYQLKAALRAYQNFAIREAVEYLGRGIECTQRMTGMPRTVEAGIRMRRGQLYMMLNDWQMSVNDLEEARRIYAEAGDRVNEGIAFAETAFGYIWAHQPEKVEEALQEIAVFAANYPNPAVELAYLNGRIFFDTVYGRLNVAGEKIVRARELCSERKFEDTQEVLAGWVQTLHAALLDHYEEADRMSVETLEKAQQHGLSHPLMYQLRWYRAVNLGRQGRYSEALPVVQENITLCQRIGDKSVQSRGWNTLGWLHGELCDWEGAIEFNRRSLELTSKIPDEEVRMNATANLADALWEQGQREEPIELLEEALENLEQCPDWMKWRYKQHLLNSLARMLGRRGDLDRGLELVDRSLELSIRTGSTRYTVKNRRVRGQILLARGEVQEAAAELKQAVELSRELKSDPQLWRSLAAVGELHQTLGEGSTMREVYGEAARVLRRVEAGLADAQLRRCLDRSPFSEQIRLGAAGHREGYPATLV